MSSPFRKCCVKNTICDRLSWLNNHLQAGLTAPSELR